MDFHDSNSSLQHLLWVYGNCKLHQGVSRYHFLPLLLVF